MPSFQVKVTFWGSVEKVHFGAAWLWLLHDQSLAAQLVSAGVFGEREGEIKTETEAEKSREKMTENQRRWILAVIKARLTHLQPRSSCWVPCFKYSWSVYCRMWGYCLLVQNLTFAWLAGFIIFIGVLTHSFQLISPSQKRKCVFNVFLGNHRWGPL